MGVLSSSLAFADKAVSGEKMNSDTQDLVIKKMERVIGTMDETDSSWIPSEQRLADLLSERARTRFMQEIEANCDGCKGSKADREKAVEVYEKLLKTVDLKGDGVILFQLAHLYQMAGKNDKAQELFEGVLKASKKQKIAKSVITRSHAGLGDLLFQKGKFNIAHQHYELALKDSEVENRALIIYNKAWCEFNQENLSQAITTLFYLLSHPDQITRTGEDGPVYDSTFHSDLLRDLATFYSKRAVTQKEIDAYANLLPKDKRKEMLLHFANEVDHIGQKRAAQIILDLYLQDPTLTKEERLQAFVNKAQVNYDQGQSSQSTQDFAKAAAAYQDHGCAKSDDCEKLQKTMKHYVTELHRSKKLKPDADLMNAYAIYTKTFPDDKEMLQRAAQVSIEANQFAMAVLYYRTISTHKGFNDKEKEEALLNEVSAAEKSQNAQLKKESYLFYVQSSTNETKKFEVRYQLAYLSYQQKQYAEASNAFAELALDPKGNADLRKKSADLALDCLAQLKDDAKFEEIAWKFAQSQPAHRAEFETMARKALTNQMAKVANDPKANSSDVKKFLDKTSDARLSTASASEKILLYENASALSLKLNDQESYVKAQTALLAQSGLKDSQKQDIYSNLAHYYEKRLDFKKAYSWASKIGDSKTPLKEREFRLGTLADLAGLSSEKHYNAALKAGLKDPKALVVRSRLIDLSRNPIAELKHQVPYLKSKPSMLNDLVLMVYAKTGNKQALGSLLNTKELKNKSAAHFILSQEIYERIQQTEKKVASSHFKSYSAISLQKGMKERVKLLNQLDSLLNESIKLKDITAQMMTLDAIATENERIVRELVAVPQPKGLSKSEQAQYVNILNAKLRPFLYKSKLAEHKRDDIWNKSPALSAMIQDYSNARPEIQKLMQHQLQLLAKVDGSGPLKSDLNSALSGSKFSTHDLMVARQSVSENPDSIKEIENLKNLETKMGHPLMPGYLEVRLNTLEKEKRL
jgi:hypothetical protein